MVQKNPKVEEKKKKKRKPFKKLKNFKKLFQETLHRIDMSNIR